MINKNLSVEEKIIYIQGRIDEATANGTEDQVYFWCGYQQALMDIIDGMTKE